MSTPPDGLPRYRVLTGPADADLNTLYDAALEFGENWRRPLTELAAERLGHLSAEDRAELAKLIEACRADIEEYVASVYTEDGTAEQVAQDAATWIAAKYPWMTAANISHGVSQGGYYAWHG